MQPSTPKTPISPAELAKLEHSFATDPESQAFIALAEAYLSMGRFMEAMVVCKKGIKAHPQDPAARVLLAQVYADQSKTKKALEELESIMQNWPDLIPALRLRGTILCKTGDAVSGQESLKRALAADPTDQQTLEICQKYGVSIPTAVQAQPVLLLEETPKTQKIGLSPKTNAEPTGHSISPVPPTASLSSSSPSQSAIANPAPSAMVPPPPSDAIIEGSAAATRPGKSAVPPRGQAVSSVASDANISPTYSEPLSDYGAPKHRQTTVIALVATVAFLFTGLAGLGGYYLVRKVGAERDRKIEKLLKKVQEEISRDSFMGYRVACDFGQQIVGELDNELYSVHAYLAYAYAIRWVEHGEGDFAEKLAREHLNRAKKAHIDHSHAIVADAYISFYSGETEAAIRSLSQSVEEKGKNSSLLLSSLGILQLRSGDLDKAVENLRAAQNLAPSDARINAALGDVFRCLGDEYFDNYEADLRYHKAANSYEAALRYQKDHGEALLGVVLMSIDTNRMDAARALINSILNERQNTLSPRQMALAHLARAIVLDADNEQAKANQAEADAFQIDSRNPDLFLLKARRLVRNGKADEAAKAVQEAIRRDSKRSSYRVQLAKMLLAKPGTGPKEAAQAIREAIRVIPNANKLYVVLGDILRIENLLDEAKNAYEKVIATSEKAPDARLALADIALSKKDYSKAIALYEKAREEFVERSRDNLISSARKQSYSLTEIAKILEARGDRKAAFEKFRQAVRADSSYPPPVFNCGRILVADREKQNRDKGFTMLEQYLKFDPKGEYADEASRLIGGRRR